MSLARAFARNLTALIGGALLSCGANQANGGGSGSEGGTSATAGGASSHAGTTSTASGSETGGAQTAGKAGAAGSNPSAAAGQPGGSGGSGQAGGPGGVMAGPIDCRAKGDGKSTITLVNQCAGTLSFRGSDIEGGDLAPGEHACRDVTSDTTMLPAIRFWGFIGMDPGGEKHTLAELTLNTDFNDFDWYNISHVDAHNLPMQVKPVEMDSCRVLTCAESLLANCPPEGQLKDAQGTLISCFSPMRDDPNSVVAQYFEASCDDAYSWSGDDSESVAACAGEDYDVVFCP